MKTSNTDLKINDKMKELMEHGTYSFPCAIYEDDITTASYPWHWHEEFELVIVKEGSAIVACNEIQHIINKGEGAFINSETLHAFLNNNSNCCIIPNIVFHPSIIGGNIGSIYWKNYIYPIMQNKKIPGIIFSPDTSWHKEVLTFINTAYASIKKEAYGYEFVARHCLSQILLLINKNLPMPSAEPKTNENIQVFRTKQMLDFIHSNYSRSITVKDISKVAAISERECLRCFNEILNTAPVKYLIHYRIEQAMVFISNTDQDITEISMNCGFQSVSYFSKVFRTHTGYTPSQYKKTR